MAAKKQTPSTTTTGTTVPDQAAIDKAALEKAAYLKANPITGGGYSTDSNTGVSADYIPKGTGKAGITENGVTTSYYNLTTGPREVLAEYGTNEIARKVLLKKLYDRGWYEGDDKPGGGLSDEDKNAVYRVMYAANLTGIPWQQVLTSVSKSPFMSASSGKGAGFRPSSTEDLVEIANRTALSTIGRKLSAEESAKFSRAYQATEQTQASGGANASNTEVFFKNRIEQKYGAESDGYKYVSAISNVAKLMENM